MKYLAIAAALVGLLSGTAEARWPACKSKTSDERAQVTCKRKLLPRVLKPRMPDGSGLTAGDKAILDSAAVRHRLESIEGELRRSR